MTPMTRAGSSWRRLLLLVGGPCAAAAAAAASDNPPAAVVPGASKGAALPNEELRSSGYHETIRCRRDEEGTSSSSSSSSWPLQVALLLRLTTPTEQLLPPERLPNQNESRFRTSQNDPPPLESHQSASHLRRTAESSPFHQRAPCQPHVHGHSHLHVDEHPHERGQLPSFRLLPPLFACDCSSWELSSLLPVALADSPPRAATPSKAAEILQELPKLLPSQPEKKDESLEHASSSPSSDSSSSSPSSTPPSSSSSSPASPPSPSSPFLTRHAIADAAALAAPAVVNLTVSVGRGLFAGQSMGSGAIIRSDGVILTNAHVVHEVISLGPLKGKLVVAMQDGRTFDGEVVGFDLLTDIAVVKVESPTPLPTVRLGCSKSLRVGDWVLALGSPLHLSNTVTAGIVSSVDRKGAELGLRGGLMDFIQTDAAINAGNSGGPLVNLDGEVVGINNMKAMAADGVSFAIPIDSAIHVLQQLAKHGRVVRPFVGIKMLNLNPAIIAQLRQRDPSFPDISSGVLVPQVIPGSPAAKGGFHPGDVIIEFDGKPVSSTKQITEILGDKVGVEFPVTVVRANNHKAKISFVTEETASDV